MTPRTIWIAIESIMALRGRSSFLLTTRHHLEPGMAPSRENAQVQRDAAVVQAVPQRMARTMSGRRRQIAPASEPTAVLMMVGTGWPEGRATSMARSGRTNMRGTRKKRPPIVLITMVITMALGTWVAGDWTSSHMEMIIPVEEVAYAA